MRILAIDWGNVRLGLAVADPTGIIATPLPPIKRKGNEKDIAELARVISEQEVSEIVIGMPLNIQGESGKSAAEVKNFALLLEKHFEGKIHFIDERYSTHAAERSLLEADVSRKKRKELRDGVAAAWILQGFLDSRNRKADG